jgi:acyl-CoA thioesterase-1
MSIVALHFASGGAFFSGAACLVVGMLVVTFGRGKLLPAIGRLLILTGMVLIGLSATPLPVWAWCVWIATLLVWIAARFLNVAGTLRVPSAARQTVTDERESIKPVVGKQGRGTRRVPATMAVIACTLAVVAWEISWQLPPRGLDGQGDRLVVIGDSLSAEDFTEGGAPWPTLLGREHGIEVKNLAFSGAKAGSAAKRVASGDFAGAVVLLEIGGNDIFGGTTSAEFERDLEALLATICRHGPEERAEPPPQATRASVNTQSVDDDSKSNRQAARPPLAKGGRAFVVMMLELPLPPLYNRFGEIQRRLARRYEVVLIPKRYFASVLIGEEATLDGLHLSPAGHKKMAELVWERVSGFVKPM